VTDFVEGTFTIVGREDIIHIATKSGSEMIPLALTKLADTGIRFRRL